MCWGAICSKGVLPLHQIEGVMTKETYHQILIRKHASILCRGYLDKKEKLGMGMCHVVRYVFFLFFFSWVGVLKRMILPPQSPDLNPIEQVWDFVKTRLEESDRVTKRTIWNELQKAWQLVTPELVQRYIATMATIKRYIATTKKIFKFF
ncbi:hypothetical protein GHT06_009908 [Daphnia sinensis]|uniref:Core-binding (CB) domain-containing protein n=1 Tax=Daphnia sinensis TaxID=1820382 RepID=A0AAD5LI51_9CRUS|nr:hypothetical protein GHT06_009908 [Daphnia sinensis]